MTSAPQRRVVVIGAGLSGAMAAQHLVENGHQVIVLDKGRGVGGRMATRRITLADGRVAVLDHGAQFFTVREPEFATMVERWQRENVVGEWCRGFSEHDGHPRFAARRGMTDVVKHLLRDVEVRTSTLVFGLRAGKTRAWDVVIDDGSCIDADGVVVTCPIAQSFSLLVQAEVQFPPALMSIDYDRTLCLLAVLDRPSGLAAPGGAQNPDDVFSWIGDNFQKGVSPIPALTFHANPAWSLAHWDDDADAAHDELRRAARPWLGSAQILASEYKKWRFATPRDTWPERCLAYGPGLPNAAPGPVVLAGDAFAGPKVEGAVLSGLTAARSLDRALAN